MSGLKAWKAAPLHQGECAGATINIRFIADAMGSATGRGIRTVRCNNASHTIAWSGRAKLAWNTVGLKNVE